MPQSASAERFCYQHASFAKTVVDERGEADPLTCAITEDGAEALETSLFENIARLEPDDVSQWGLGQASPDGSAGLV